MSILAQPQAEWTLAEWIVAFMPLILLALAALTWLFMRNTIRTRIRVAKSLKQDPDINEWLVAFNWSRKILYMPTIVLSFAFAVVMLFFKPESAVGNVLGGIWLLVFLANFLVDEYEMSLKVLFLAILVFLLVAGWLYFLGWFGRVWAFVQHVSFTMNWTGYLLLGLIFLTAVAVSWFRGLFYYVAITPNYLNLQTGPTETGEQISREEYSTRIDTGDFLERLSGFGRIVITFADHRRPPLILLVGNIGEKAKTLESIRGKLAVDYHQPGREGTI